MNDRESTKQRQVEEVVRTICISYSVLRQNFISQYTTISSLLGCGEVTQAVKALMDVFRLPKGLISQIGYEATMDEVAAVHINLSMLHPPQRGAATLYFKASRAELSKEKIARVVHKIAHELSHVRLRLDVHTHRESEFATDILALLVTGGVGDFKEIFHDTIEFAGMEIPVVEYGYIREDLWPEVLQQLRRYANIIYLRKI